MRCAASRTSKALHASALSSRVRAGSEPTLSQVLATLGTRLLFPDLSLLKQANKRGGVFLQKKFPGTKRNEKLLLTPRGEAAVTL